eukprot:3920498-Ditylum_brightwellii.AAC.1
MSKRSAEAPLYPMPLPMHRADSGSIPVIGGGTVNPGNVENNNNGPEFGSKEEGESGIDGEAGQGGDIPLSDLVESTSGGPDTNVDESG